MDEHYNEDGPFIGRPDKNNTDNTNMDNENTFGENTNENTFGDNTNINSDNDTFDSIDNDYREEVQEETLLEKFNRLQRRDTNYVFLFGQPASGKSYITASIIYYLQTSGLGSLHMSDTNSMESQLIADDMFEKFHTGRFINRSDQTTETPYEIDLVFRPNDNTLPEMKLTFLEMSGEHLKSVQVKKGDANSGRLPDDIDEFLMCPDINLIFFLVADHLNAMKDSMSINKFLNYAYNKDPRFDKSNYLLAVTKWDTYTGKHKDNVEHFTKENMPQVHNYLKNNDVSNAIMHYSIGSVVSRNVNGVVTEQITNLDISRAEALTDWLYQTITKQSLEPVPPPPEPTLWNKIRDFMGF